jgi:peptide/nickel transport system permease protein
MSETAADWAVAGPKVTRSVHASPAWRSWRAFRRNRSAVAALCLLVLISVVCPTAVLWVAANPGALSADVLSPPSGSHPMGTDYLGRDILVRVLDGVTTSLIVGGTVAIIAASIGVLVGVVAGYYGKWADLAAMRFADALLIIPTFLLVLAIASVFGGRLATVIVLLGATLWSQIARIVRAEVLTLREEAFVLSGRAIGASDARLMFRGILPNALPPVIALMALLASAGILTEASLSFLGIGDPNVISLGQMLTNGLEYATTAWWVPTFPGAAIFVLVLLLNLLGDGLNAALNPRLWRR